MKVATVHNESIAETFNRYFSVCLVNSIDALHKAQRVRYNVYCEEFAYENRDSFPDKLESDEYDAQSTHALVEHRSTGIAAGCVRMVPTSSTAINTPLPFEKYCGDSLDHEYVASLNLERSSMCEISRLAVDGNFRRRGPNEKQSRFGRVEKIDFAPDERRTLPMIAVSAYLAATAITDKSGYCNVFAMMEPFLPRLMARSGLHFQRVGRNIDYHGKRAPYFITTQSALETMNTELRELYHVIRSQLYPAH